MYRPTRREFVFQKAEPAAVANEWLFDPSSILASPRKVKGKFHTPKIDRDNEYIEKTAVQNAVPDFMHLPILHDFHKERTVGIVTRVVELSDGSFDFEGLIKATDDCNDIWELIESGNYDQVSIYGKRTCGSDSCSMRPEQRTEPCTTTGVRLDSISVCDGNARNDGTSLMVAKGAKVVFTATDDIIKAETTDSSLMHTVTDYPRKFGSDGLPRTKKKCTATCPQYERQELGKGDDMDEDVKQKPIRVGDKAKRKEPSQGEDYHDGKFEKGAESIEAKIDHLCGVVEKLVGMDEGSKADNNYADKNQQPEGGEEWEHKPAQSVDEPEYGLPTPEGGEPEESPLDEEDKAYQHKVDTAGANLDSRAVSANVRTSGKTSGDSLTSDEELNHLAAKYHLDKQAKMNKQKEAFTSQTAPTGRADDIGLDQKAGDPRRPKEYSTRESYDRPPAEDPGRAKNSEEIKEERIARRKKETEAGEKNAPRPRGEPSSIQTKQPTPANPPWAKQEHSAKPEARNENARQAAKENVEKIPEQTGGDIKPDVEPGHPKPKPLAEGEHKPLPPAPKGIGEEKRMTPEQFKIAQYNAKHGGPKVSQETGGEKKLPYQSEGASEPTRVKRQTKDSSSEEGIHSDSSSYGGAEEKAEDSQEMPDIESRIDRLISVVERLVQSDRQVHAKMGVEPNEEEKATMSKGTETMNDEEVNTIVKAKVEEITKAYIVQLDELKKANTELSARIDKMEKETIEKSGVVAILREGDEEMGAVFQSNAAALSSMKPKAKV